MAVRSVQYAYLGTCTSELVDNMRRLDIQLDDERRRRLNELGEERAVHLSEVVGGLIDNAYTDFVQERRRLAAARMIQLGVEDPPDPATLARELEGTHGPRGIH